MDRSDAADGDERDDRVHLVGCRDLAGQLMAESRIQPLTREQRRSGERRCRPVGNRAAMNGHEPRGRRLWSLIADKLGKILPEETCEMIEHLSDQLVRACRWEA